MSNSILSRGEKIFVIHRQMFHGDVRRHFFGVVDECADGVARVTGSVFSLDSLTNQFTRRRASRTRVIPLASADIIVNVLPSTVDLERIHYISTQGGQIEVTDGNGWSLDINPN